MHALDYWRASTLLDNVSKAPKWVENGWMAKTETQSLYSEAEFQFSANPHSPLSSRRSSNFEGGDTVTTRPRRLVTHGINACGHARQRPHTEEPAASFAGSWPARWLAHWLTASPLAHTLAHGQHTGSCAGSRPAHWLTASRLADTLAGGQRCLLTASRAGRDSQQHHSFVHGSRTRFVDI